MLRGGTQAASPESRTLFLPASGISAQNMRSRMSACESTRMPAFDILSSWTRRIWRSVSISGLIAVEGELDRHTFGGFHQQRCIVAVGRFLRSLRGQTFEQLREIDFG